MKTILLLGAGALYADSISAVKEAGYKTVCVDRNPFAPTRQLSDAFENIDIRNVDGLVKVARKYHADGIMPLSEFGVLAGAQAATKLGIPSLPVEVAQNCTNKINMRKLWHAAGVRQPAYYVIRNYEDAVDAGLRLGYPFIMKPPCSGGSRGVVNVNDPSEVYNLFKEAARFSEESELLAESFMVGEELSVEALIRQNRLFILAVAIKEIIPAFPYRITNALNYGYSLSDNQIKDLEVQLEMAVNALGLNDWLIHSEFILTHRGLEIIELAARGGGGYIFGSIVEYVSGYPYVAALAKRVTGDELPFPDDLRNRASSFRFIIPPPGRIVSITGIEEARSMPYVNRAEMWVKTGDAAPFVTNGSQRSGCVITHALDFKTAKETGVKACDIIRVQVEDIP
jgi:biotin carboxylase